MRATTRNITGEQTQNAWGHADLELRFDEYVATKTEHVSKTTPTMVCRPKQHIAFLKVHKCASSTIGSVIQKFGIEHDLVFGLPKQDTGHVGWPEPIVPDHVYFYNEAAAAGLKIEMIVHHSVFNLTTFETIMPNDTVFVTILREPFEQFASGINFFGAAQFLELPRNSDRVETFLRQPERYEREVPFWFGHHHLAGKKSITRNMMATDLGYPDDKFHDTEFALEYNDFLSKTFLVVMIKENIHESLVVLRRRLCWKLKNILFRRLNKRYSEDEIGYSEYSDRIHGSHKNWSSVDYLLYGHFKRKLEQEIEDGGIDLMDEVTHFISVNDKFNSFCEGLGRTSTDAKLSTDRYLARQSMLVPATKWNNNFEMTAGDCLQLSKMPWEITWSQRRRFDQRLRERQRIFESRKKS
ncbi:galactosylceramide sulfotransferase-like [Lineus longissimus]|uniref:galactosylceramide sulfotransferase-like n=1 Tax=Lineus longissimus TaxID=88925 RepID=UPI00315C918C